MTTILFVPISIVGCGKSTVFRTLHSLYPSFAHVENDNYDKKHAFYGDVRAAVNDPLVPAVLLDRNNHLRVHRKEIMSNFKSKKVVVVALLFVPHTTLAQKMHALVLDRIVKRGNNHQQVKSQSNIGKTKMIIASFVKSFAPYDAGISADKGFDYVVKMSTNRESSEENVRRIVKFLAGFDCASHGILGFGAVSDAQIKKAFQKSLVFQVP